MPPGPPPQFLQTQPSAPGAQREPPFGVYTPLPSPSSSVTPRLQTTAQNQPPCRQELCHHAGGCYQGSGSPSLKQLHQRSSPAIQQIPGVQGRGGN